MEAKETLTIEYRNKVDGLMYLQFDANIKTDSKRVCLWCSDDKTGRHDRVVDREELETNYIKIREYMEESGLYD